MAIPGLGPVTALTFSTTAFLWQRLAIFWPAVDEGGRVHGAPGLADRNWIDQVIEQSADAVAEPRKSGYSGEQETKMAEKRKKPPIKSARLNR
jgi:hypothetical protein